MKEQWKDIPEYEGKYYISNFGRLKNNKGLIMKPMICTNGYLAACLWKNNKQRKFLIHRLVADAFLENINGYSEINHIDEDKTNNAVINLEWCTHLYNMNYGSVKKRISTSKMGKELSLEHKAKCGLSALNKKWINKNNKEILVRKEEIPSFLLEGWNLGRRKRKCLKKLTLAM